MEIFDLIAALKKEPQPEKVARGMRYLAGGCAFAGVWNYFIVYFDERFRQPPFSVPEYSPPLALGVFLSLGLLFFLSGHGIGQLAPWGKRLAQVSVALLLLAMAGLFLLIGEEFPRLFLSLATLVTSGIPAYLVVRYLGRLPVRHESFIAEPPDLSGSASFPVVTPTEQERYHDSLAPFGIFGGMVIFIAGFALTFNLMPDLLESRPELAILPVLSVLLLAISANYLPSPFQRSRKTIAAFTGGGGTFWFHGSIPFVRLLVYADGVELRIMLQRYFIPYQKMSPPENKTSFFSSGIVFESDLPGVPSRLRFSAWGNEKIVRLVRENFDRR